MKNQIIFLVIGMLFLSFFSCDKNDIPKKDDKQERPKIAHYPFSTDYSDLTGNNDDARQENTSLKDGGVFMDGNYLWDDDEGSVLWIPKIKNFHPDNFRLSLGFKVARLPDLNKPIIVLGHRKRWAMIYITPSGQLNLAFNDVPRKKNLSDQSIEPDKWLNLSMERNETGVFIVKVDGIIFFRTESTVLDHENDNSLAAYHGGNGNMFHGYWRNLVIR
ncbi:hypothetical protein KUV50_16230 [Membranicola marinus]|uniref:Uncharacterized protein n=1 Tax=Membranihabitans marinus TaxID=1227546 RepID=A0A953HXP3_9BACT|nr:hypothetical protein [Membranihabitans marinus]MBY5959703.1 hypothetical protein [Membranihabitans marinus]